MRAWRFSWATVLLCTGCYKMHWVVPAAAGDTGQSTDATGQSGVVGKDSPGGGQAPEPSCSHFEEVSVEAVGQVDLLFIVDNSDSMGEEQAALRNAFPRMIDALTTGDRDGDGVRDFPPAADLHLGVVSTDMGLAGVQGIKGCQGLGQDGVLRHTPSSSLPGCEVSYPSFLSFSQGRDDPSQTAADFACIAMLGTGGCGFEHQLEAGLKALWPAKDPMPDPKTNSNRITFLADPATGQGGLGHGDLENAGFLRSDSLLGIVLLSDEDDCSPSDTRPFQPPQYLDPSDPLIQQGMNLRCHYNQKALFPIDRYVNGWKALRPGNDALVVFAAITGVPADLVSTDALARVDFSNAKQRDKFYADMLADVRMKEQVDDRGTPDPSDDRLLHSCMSAGGAADPPRRIVQVARGFGANGIVQSICQADFTPALDAIVAKLGTQLATRCVGTP